MHLKKKFVKKEIADLINSIKEHADALHEDKHIPQLELNVILDKIEKLYQKSIVFSYLNSLNEDEVDAPIANKEPEILSNIESVGTLDLFSAAPEPIPPKVELPTIVEEIKVVEEVKTQAEPASNTLHDVRNFIGINEKFQFINELFHGNMNEYNVAINQINSFEKESEIEYYLTKLKEVYKWDDENPQVLSFAETIKKRFK